MNHFDWKYFLRFTTIYAVGITLANFLWQLQTEVNWTDIAFKTIFSAVITGFLMTYWKMRKEQKKENL